MCVGAFQLLKYGVGKSSGYVFVGIVAVAAIVMHFVYQRRLARLRDDVDEMSDEERSRFLQDVDPEIAEDLWRKDDAKNPSAKPTAAGNDGPVKPVGDSGATEGQPSVS